MSCRIAKAILVNEIDQEAAYLYDSVSGWAFGPQFESVEDAKAFLDWLDAEFGGGRASDPRGFADDKIQKLFEEWLNGRTPA